MPSDEWIIEKAKLEDGCEVGAGMLAADPTQTSMVEQAREIAKELAPQPDNPLRASYEKAALAALQSKSSLIDEVREGLEELARQQTREEAEAEDGGGGDYEYGYDCMVEKARNLLAKLGERT